MRCGCSLLKALLSARKKVLSVVPFPLDRSVIGLHFNSVPFISVRRTQSQSEEKVVHLPGKARRRGGGHVDAPRVLRACRMQARSEQGVHAAMLLAVAG